MVALIAAEVVSEGLDRSVGGLNAGVNRVGTPNAGARIEVNSWI
jgi:hypothetical protein